MKKIKYITCAVLVCLIMLFACIPKASAYSEYVSLNNDDTILFQTEHSITFTELVDINYQSLVFGNLTLDYIYRLENDKYYLHIYRYEYFVNGEYINDTLDESIELPSEVFNLIGVESEDREYIDYLYDVFDKNILYITIRLEGESGSFYPIIYIHDYEYYYVDYEIELQPFLNLTGDVSFVYLFDFELELIHSTMLYETYLYNRYRLDGNSLSQIEDVSITDWLINSVGGLFDTPILGGVSIGDILMFILAIGLLFLFLRFFAGG